MSDQPPTAPDDRPRDPDDDPDGAPAGGPDGAPGDPGTGPDRPGADEPPGAGQVAGGPGSGGALAPLLQRRPAPPPKRTGVFVDPDELRTHVGDLLRAILGGYEVDAWGNFTFDFEGARVFVTVGPTPIGPQVGVFSITNLGLELTPELGEFLLTTNHALGFGAFSYDPDNQAVWLRHSLLGTMLDGPELQAAVGAVASTAAKADDAIRERFGGRAFNEEPDDVRQRTRPPDPTDASAGTSATGYL